MRKMFTAAGVAVLLLAGCSAGEPEAEADEPIDSRVDLVTSDGGVAANEDDERCLWGETQVIVRDGSGNILVSYGPADMVGAVLETPPNYKCRNWLSNFDLPVADFYEFEVETELISLTGDGGTVTVTETLSRDRVEGHNLEIEVERGNRS